MQQENRGDGAVDIVVHLVHGTWSKKAQWTQPQSKLRAEIEAKLRPEKVEFLAFPWSGRNRIGARDSAAEQFGIHLRDALREHPSSRHFVIGHSHGGSLAYLTLGRDPSLARQVHLLACLATPFIHARRRHEGSHPEKFPWTLASFLGAAWLALAALQFHFAPAIAKAADDRGIPGDLILGLAAFSSIVVLLCMPFVFGSLRRGMRAFDIEVQRRVALAPALETRTLLIRASGDEASSFVAFPQLVSTALAALIDRARALPSPADWLDLLERARRGRLAWLARFTRFLVGAGAIAGTVFGGIALLEGLLTSKEITTLLRVTGVALSLGLYSWMTEVKAAGVWLIRVLWRCAIAVATFPLNLLAAFLGIFVGYEYVLASRRLLLSVEHSPPGRHEVTLLRDQPLSYDLPASRVREGGGLRHSLVYNSSEALALICDAIRSSRKSFRPTYSGSLHLAPRGAASWRAPPDPAGWSSQT